MTTDRVGQQIDRAESRGLLAWLKKPRGFDLNPSTMYLIGLGLYLAVELVQTTMLNRSGFEFASEIRGVQNALQWLSVLFVGGNIVSRSYKQGEMVASALTVIVAVVVWRVSGYQAVFFLAVMVIGAKDVPFDSIVKLFLALTLLVTIVSIAAIMVGLVPEASFSRPDGTVRYAFGSIHPNTFAARAFFWVCGWFYLRRDRHNFLDFLLTLGLSLLVFLLTDSRTSSLLLFFLTGVVLILAIRRIATKRDLRYGIVLKILLIALPLLCMVFALSLQVFYDPEIPWLAQLNKSTTGRLAFGHDAFLMYPVTLFGQHIANNINGTKGVLIIIDSSYLSVLLRYGLFFFLEIVALLVLISVRSFRHREYVLPLVIVLVAAHAMAEGCLPRLWFNIFLLAGTAALPKKQSRISITPRASETGRGSPPGESGRLGVSRGLASGYTTPTPRVSQVKRDFATPRVSRTESDLVVLPGSGVMLPVVPPQAAMPPGGQGRPRRSNTPRVSDSRALQRLGRTDSSAVSDVFDAAENPHTAWRIHLAQGKDDT